MCILFVLHIPRGQSLEYMNGNNPQNSNKQTLEGSLKKKKFAFQKEEYTRQWESDLTGKYS